MKITKIELIDYKRFSLRNIKRFVYEPKEQVQLILGTNGSGKSSLLKELTPLPANSLDYLKTGSKTIYIEHNNRNYVLISRFSPKQEHSFIVDNEELNLGGTIGTQKELVREYFNITQEIHDLLISSDSFTKMSPSERRSWFTKISDTNYTYAINIFNKLKERLRDITGSIKTTNVRLVQERAKVLNDTDIQAIKSEIEELTSVLNNLINKKGLNKRQTTDLEISNRSIEQTLLKEALYVKELVRKFESIISENYEDALLTPEDIFLEKETTFTELKVIESKIEQISKLHASEQEILNSIEQNSVYSTETLDLDITRITQRIQSIKNSLSILKDINIDSSYLTSLDSITTDFISLCNNIQDNADYRFSRTKLEEIKSSIIANENQIVNINREIATVSANIKQQEEVRDHDKITCPNCEHTWSRGYDQKYYNSLLKELEKLKILIFDEEKLQQRLKLEEIEITEYFKQYREIQQFIKSFNVFNDLWNLVIEQELLLKDPKKISLLFSKYREDIIAAIEGVKLTKELNELLRIKEITSKNSDVNKDQVRVRLTELENQLYENNLLLTSLRTQSRRITELANIFTNIEQFSKKLNELLTNKENLKEELIANYFNDAVNKLITEVKVMLSSREKSLSEINMQTAVIESLEQSLFEFKDKEAAYKKLVETLSPSNGLIAEGLTGFINSFISQVNHFIANIWSYPLSLVPIQVSEEGDCELDYRFEVSINDTEVIPDISKGSGAMKEVIDLAFKIITMKYLGLSTYPVYLDEFAKTLDHAHRTTAHKTVVDLITQSNFSQVFIVNHYADLYGSIRNADITVLHEENIIIPKDSDINQCVVFN